MTCWAPGPGLQLASVTYCLYLLRTPLNYSSCFVTKWTFWGTPNPVVQTNVWYVTLGGKNGRVFEHEFVCYTSQNTDFVSCEFSLFKEYTKLSITSVVMVWLSLDLENKSFLMERVAQSVYCIVISSAPDNCLLLVKVCSEIKDLFWRCSAAVWNLRHVRYWWCVSHCAEVWCT